MTMSASLSTTSDLPPTSSTSSSSSNPSSRGATGNKPPPVPSAELSTSVGAAATPVAGGGSHILGTTFAASVTLVGIPKYARPAKEDVMSLLPDEVLHRILLFVDVDSGVHASMLATRWQHVFTERVCKHHCERIYLDQPQVKVLNPARFNSSWRKMLMRRPRVRTNGFYYLLSSYIKKPMRDMWTEVAIGTILEVKYYRYFRFLSNGRLVYSMLYQPPQEAIRLFREGRHKELYEGTYYIHRGEVHCQVQTTYAMINFKMEVQDGNRGKFSQLYLKEHSSLPYSDPTGTPIPHRTPYDTICYHRVPQW